MTSPESPPVSGPPPDHDPVSALAVLGDESRRRLLEFVRRAQHPVTRDEASAAIGLSRKLAAFHLDKLVSAGLLQAHSGGRAGRTRVGRAPKVYEPAPHTIEVSLPPRRNELLAALLVAALADQEPGESAREAAVRTARVRGEAMGRDAQAVRPADRDPHRHTVESLEQLGYEPEERPPAVTILRNCPFHPVAAQAPELICAMNHAFLGGYLTGLGDTSTTPVLHSRPAACCVELRGDGEALPEDEDTACGRTDP